MYANAYDDEEVDCDDDADVGGSDDESEDDIHNSDFDDVSSGSDYDEDEVTPRKATPPAYKEEEDPGEMTGMARVMFDAWVYRKQVLDHPNSIGSWMLSIDPNIRQDVKERCVEEHKQILKGVVLRLHMSPCPNENYVRTRGVKVSELDAEDLWGVFLDEWHQFKTQSGDIYGKPEIWEDECVRLGDSKRWHRRYSDMTAVLGFTAMRVTSKPNGIGECERTWRGVKEVKGGKKSHLKPRQTKMRSICYVSSSMERARLHREYKLQRDAQCEFNMEDLEFNAGLLKHGVDVETLQQKSPQRIFRAYVEKWEEAARHERKDDAKDGILRKYGGIRFRDPVNGKTMEVHHKECFWQGAKKSDPEGETWGWHVEAFDPADSEEDDDMEPFDLEIVHDNLEGVVQKEDIAFFYEEHGGK